MAFGMEEVASAAARHTEAVSLEVRIVGRVQGVGFRYFAHDIGRRLRLGGYVTNLPDGTVRAYAEGPRGILEEFLRQMERGPAGAHVRETRSHWAHATCGYTHFSIERPSSPGGGPPMVIDELNNASGYSRFPESWHSLSRHHAALSDGRAFRQAIGVSADGTWIATSTSWSASRRAASSWSLGLAGRGERPGPQEEVALQTNRTTYALEYRTDTLEVQTPSRQDSVVRRMTSLPPVGRSRRRAGAAAGREIVSWHF
jgi:acylphosphatase